MIALPSELHRISVDYICQQLGSEIYIAQMIELRDYSQYDKSSQQAWFKLIMKKTNNH